MKTTACHLVYFAFLGFEDDENIINARAKIIDEQLKWIRKIKNRNIKQYFIVPCASYKNEQVLFDLADANGFVCLNKFNLRANMYEYPGILAVKTLCNILPDDDVIIYCHSKGSVNQHIRSAGNFKFNIEILLDESSNDVFSNNNVNVAGVFSDMDGFVWYNYFMARVKYLNTIPLIINENRFYYEKWLKYGGNTGLCVSLYKNKHNNLNLDEKDFYSAEDLNKNKSLNEIYEKYASM